MRDMVALVELNGACCRSIARKLRAEHIYCKILPASATAADVAAQEPLGVILAGGDSGVPYLVPEGAGWLDTGLPLLAMGDAALGLCMSLGGQPLRGLALHQRWRKSPSRNSSLICSIRWRRANATSRIPGG